MGVKDKFFRPKPSKRSESLDERSPFAGCLPPGSQIMGQYDVAQVLHGGMGVVYLCYDRDEDRPVALKTFLPQFLSSRAVRDRFLREATVWIDLDRHPNIVSAYAIRHLDRTLETYIVLELVAAEKEKENASLSAWLRPGRPLSVEQSVLFALQVARGMRHACSRMPNLVHRDLKPGNILVGADARARVTDFGLATVLEGTDRDIPLDADSGVDLLRRTQLTHGIAGTPLYMAPEQWARKTLDARTDVYALGCILYEMLAGEPAVMGKTLKDIEQAHTEGRLRAMSPNIPDEIAGILQRCLSLDCAARYKDWSEVESALTVAYKHVANRDAPVEAAGEALTKEERIDTGWSYQGIGNSYVTLGKLDVAIGYFERALKIGREEDEKDLQTGALAMLGTVYQEKLDTKKALEYYEQALEFAREIGSRYYEGTCLMEIGNIHFAHREFEQALVYHKQARQILHEIGALSGEMNVLNNMGIVYYEMGQTQEAAKYHEMALAFARILEDRRHESAHLGELGNDYARLGDFAKAEKYYRECIAVKREIGDGMGEARWMMKLGVELAQRDREEEAVALLDAAARLFSELGHQHLVETAMSLMARVLHNREQNAPLSLEKLMQMVEQACRGNAQLQTQLAPLTKSLSQDTRQPPEIRALGETLNRILSGNRNVDVSSLPPEYAKAVRTLLSRI